MDFDDPDARLEHLLQLEKLSETLADRDGGELFQRDLEEARQLAASDARFEPLVEGLAAETLGERMAAVNRFFESVPATELATLQLPMNLSQLRQIFLSSR
ncbi:MAG: hypothetical protein GKS06_18225 [Acidobacteria bacterium]|nr:hypothetical protein [Acidobacteriota bacterium]